MLIAKKLIGYSLLVGIISLSLVSNAKAADILNHTLTFSNKTVVKTFFYPYRNPANVLNPYDGRTLQGITVDSNNNMYLTYVTGDKTTYGYVYKYSPSGVLLKKSAMLTTGHAQGIAFNNGYLYLLSNVSGKPYKLYKMDPNKLTIVKTWDLPSIVHPNVIAMLNSTTAVGVSKSADGSGYEIYKMYLGTGSSTTMNWKERIHVNGLVGTTSNKPIQGFTYSGGKYYLLSDGEYMSFDINGKNINRVKLNTTREPEGIAVDSKGKLLIQFNYYNEVFKQQ